MYTTLSLNGFGNSKILGATEQYLTPFSREPQKSYFSTALKICSYATIVFPLIAINIYISYYILNALKTAFRSSYQTTFESYKNYFMEYIKDHDFRKKAKNNPALPSTVPTKGVSFEQTLNHALKGPNEFLDSLPETFQHLWTLNENLIANPKDPKVIDQAKQGYKKVRDFMDKEILSKDLPEKDEVNSHDGYINCAEKRMLPSVIEMPNILHSCPRLGYLYFILNHLRKNIRLYTKVDSVKKHLGSTPSDLINLKWLHGSKASTILLAHNLTNNKLVPTGELKNRGLSPISGELQIGANSFGINQSSLSGTSLYFSKTPIDYGKRFVFNLDTEKKYVDQLLEFSPLDWTTLCGKSFDSSGDAIYFSRIAHALSRLKKFDQNAYLQLRPKAVNKMKELKEKYEKFVIQNPPAELSSKSDGYYTIQLASQLEDFAQIELILSDQEKTSISETLIDDQTLYSIPVVFGSNTKTGRVPNDYPGRSYSEECIDQNLELGKDIQYVFTSDEHVKKVSDVVKKCQLDLKILSFNQLENVTKQEQKLAPYFYDVWRVRKNHRKNNTSSHFFSVPQAIKNLLS